jgi:hypothetical protein
MVRFVAQAVQPVMARTTVDFDEHCRDIAAHMLINTLYHLNDPKGTRRYVIQSARNLACNVLEKIAPKIRVFREVLPHDTWAPDADPKEIRALYADHGYDVVQVRPVKGGWSVCGYMRRIHTTGFADVAEGSPADSFDWDYYTSCISTVAAGRIIDAHKTLAIDVARRLEESAAEGTIPTRPNLRMTVRRAMLEVRPTAPPNEVFFVQTLLRRAYRLYREAYPLMPEQPPYAIMDGADE